MTDRPARGHPGSERRLASVLFADVVGSTRIVADADPEDAADLLDRAVARMRRSVRAFGGTIARVEGDGLFAIFGAPDAYGDTPLRACAAALDMIQRFSGEDPLRTPSGDAIEIRVGIATGHILFRDIVNDAGAVYDAVGMPAHLASHMESVAAPNTVLCDTLTAEFSQPAFRSRAIDPKERGKLADDQPLFLIEGFRATGRQESRLANRPLFGRETETRRLQGLLEQGNPDGPAIPVIEGPPGSGKSAICRAVLDRLRSQGKLCLAATANRYARHAPFQCFGDWLAQLVRLRLPEVTGARAFADWLHRDQPDLPDNIVEQIVAIAIGTPQPDTPPAGPPVSGDVVRSALVATCRRLIGQDDALLFLDDAQWADEPSLSALGALVADGGTGGLLATREIAELPEGALTVRPFELAPLSEAAIRSWLAFEFSGEIPFDDDLVATLSALESPAIVVQQLAEAPGLVDDLKRFATGMELSALDNRRGSTTEDLHPVLEFLLGERFDHLSTNAYSVLQQAALLGMQGRTGVLSQLGGLDRPAFLAAFDELVTAGLMERRLGPDGLSFALGHSTIQRLVHNRTPRAARRRLHARIHDCLLEELADGRTAEQVVIAHHARLGDRFEAACRHFSAAATQAGLRGAYGNAGELVRLAQDCIGEIEEGPARNRAIVEITHPALTALVNLGRREESRGLLGEAWQAALSLDDPAAQARVRMARAVGLWKAGQHRAAMTDALAVMRAGEALGQPATWGLGLARFLPPVVDLGAYDLCAMSAPFWMLRLRQLALEGTFGGLHAVAASFAARACLEVGEYFLAERIFADAGMSPDLDARDFGSVGVMLAYAQMQRRLGRHALALELCERAHGWCRSSGIFNLRGVASAWLASAALYEGRPDRAATVLEEDRAFGEPGISGIYAAGHYATAEALVALVRGESEAARIRADRAIALATRHGEGGNRARALLLRACVAWLAAEGDAQSCLEDLGEARQLARSRRMQATLAPLDLLIAAARERWPAEAADLLDRGETGAPTAAGETAAAPAVQDLLSGRPDRLFRHIVLN